MACILVSVLLLPGDQSAEGSQAEVYNRLSTIGFRQTPADSVVTRSQLIKFGRMKITRAIQTVDSHTEGNPTRVVVGSLAVPPGRTLAQRQDWLKAHDDQLRRLLNFEPRGSGMMCSAVVMPPIQDADFSVLLLEQD